MLGGSLSVAVGVDTADKNFAKEIFGSRTGVKDNTAGLVHTCVLLDDSNIKCWENRANGRLGLGCINNYGDESSEV